MKRCKWAGNDQFMVQYHDNEWGVPVHEDRVLFEFLILEGAQAGLSWSTILNKRENYRKALDNFDPEKIAKYSHIKVDELLNNTGIIRNKMKISSIINNAQKFLEIQKDFGSFDSFIWSFTNGKPIQNKWQNSSEVPSQSKVSCEMSKKLKKRGFKFTGPVICYSFMQAVGMINDHTIDCFRHKQIMDNVI
ncbi:3-methyl-adenine DNA glycosylase I, constitutive [Desulfamplus magnetovallimortis]|uniref:DNA-3-methyladenine glycosylase I n=1 Tax=Desulfamplus magnetovallimortis TaxID=1246637 RepID=A0A1W1H5J1_9BACT|nr:DNA-3-methyladenine glycosylase I [Desulfamplus magnetovallimortis]SLM27645.1 3-methyl-adenine DNA glycosylase I, constitutive [Desulfamplus magnetovallimortis]